ncbi:fimbria/pilus outer membrane usher protein (plasmid) [Paraburkholderia sp. PREW-6R]|uniref:fimbria/pilus outer membrane usher protein n=1 Tax=Paraburkholderia sp. PREW-6R TaxID=3141544 RepID=UPI0031F5B766
MDRLVSCLHFETLPAGHLRGGIYAWRAQTRLFRALTLSAGIMLFYGARAQSLPLTAGMDPDGIHNLILEVNVNGQPTGLLGHFRDVDGRLWVDARELASIGVNTQRLGIPDTAEVSLDVIPDLHYAYDAGRQVLTLDIPDSVRKPYTFDNRSLQATMPASASRGFVLNYDAFAQTTGAQQFALYNDSRYFDPSGVLNNTGIAYLSARGQRYMRYDTSWGHSNPAGPSTIQFGDTISSALAWTRAIRLGGLQWKSDFALRPDLVTFPVPALTGSAVVPSAVELYVNNVHQFTGTVPSGPFVLNTVPGITGAGQASLVTHDALGRLVTTSVPLYVDTRLLAPGLSSYSVEAGFLRRNYGSASFDYDPRPAFSGSLRRGLTDSLTVEGHAEATSGVVNAGAGALLRLGMSGVLNGSLSASSGHLPGTQLGVGYQLIEPAFSINAQTIRSFGSYGDLASRDGAPVAAATDQITIALPFRRQQTLAVNYIGYRLQQGPASKIGSLSYTFNFGTSVSLNLSTYRDFGQHNASGAFVSINFGMDHHTSVNTTAGRQDGLPDYNVDVIRAPDYDGGWGWGVQMGNTGTAPYQQAQLEYLGSIGEITTAAQNVGRRRSASLDASGALVLMDGSVQGSRHVYDGFAMVSTDGFAGIPVLHDNRLIGTTDRSGHLLVPDLNAYESNQISIDSMGLPADARVGLTSLQIVPQAQSGVLAHFEVARYRAASVILQTPDGRPLPPGARVHHVESGKDTIVGYDGMTFIEELRNQNHLVVQNGSLNCTAVFDYRHPVDASLPTIGPLPCGSAQGGVR